jgi:hypothetical protein
MAFTPEERRKRLRELIKFKKDCRSNKIPSHLQNQFHSLGEENRQQLTAMKDIAKAIGPIKASKASQKSDPSNITRQLQKKDEKYQVNANTVYRPFDTTSSSSNSSGGTLSFHMPVIKVPELHQVPTKTSSTTTDKKPKVSPKKVENKETIQETPNDRVVMSTQSLQLLFTV